MNGRRKIKLVIIVLSVLLAISLLALGGIILHNHLSDGNSTEVIVPANVITDEKKQDPSTDRVPESPEAEGATATVISLNARRAEDNTVFQAGNMFPGDSETKYYCVQVSHKDNITLCFQTDVHPGYDKLAEVLHCRIALPEKNVVLYDGLMRDMPKALEQTLKTSESTKSEIYYEITAYLKTSVGNEYMDKSLVADFRWWAEEKDHLDNPKTGDFSNLCLWVGVASGTLLLLLLLLLKKRKQEGVANEQ